MKNKLDLILVVPVFNEEKIIKTVIKRWLIELKKIKFKIIIINDGSTDNTKQIINSIVTNKIILLNKKNSGHGPSIIQGYKAALKLKPNHIFQVDSDDQFYASDFKNFWKYREKFDFIIGYRSIRNDPFHRLVVTRILKLLIFSIFGLYIKDINVPYRLIRTNCLLHCMKYIENNNAIPNVLVSLIASKKFKCQTEIVRHKKRVTGKVVLANLNLIKFCFKAALELIIFRIKKF
jgi:glycosyltransferase involved in cell wall biosynthesis